MKLEVIIVEGAIASLKVALTEAVTSTLVATFAGLVTVIVGARVSAAPACQLQGLGTVPLIKALPATSLAAVEIVALYQVLADKSTSGLNVAVVPT